MANEWESQDLNPCNLAPAYIRSTTVLYEPKHLGEAAA